MKIGLDIGSTTMKAVVLDEQETIIYKTYERHYSRIAEKAVEMLENISKEFGNKPMCLTVSGSAGMGISEKFDIPFVQEVYATRVAVDNVIPDTDVVIELGGEDAKILFLSDNDLEVRMNGSCAGGTGAFIDQMATLLRTTPTELDNMAADYEKIYTIASRCGVFAKSDVQPLLNQGANKSDIAASIMAAVVNQTISGLAQGREIKGKVVYLGGPMTFLTELRKSFDRILDIEGICPENSLYFVAYGTALLGEGLCDLSELTESIKNSTASEEYNSCSPLFANDDEYNEFFQRHAENSVENIIKNDYNGNIYIGLDAGSTTIKATAIDEGGNILLSSYKSNGGNPVPAVKKFLEELYDKYPNATIKSSAVTGYGEDMIKNAFCLDYGIVETIAHFTAAKKFRPDVDFIIDIGGQDIKCFKIKNGVIDNIFLNEACSSGCGSFLQTFAGALGYSIEDFAKLGLFADKPVDLGSRCTVFMNSSVKQAQKEGASIENISAGLSISVVKNALYKVIRASGPDDLGQSIVVQGGTFLNDAVLRAFEQEIGRNVIRPSIAGLMGAYGAAIYSKEKAKKESSILSREDLKSFSHESKTTTCNGCSNHCSLTINTFGGGRRYIGGNRCEKPVTGNSDSKKYNLFDYKVNLLDTYSDKRKQHELHSNSRGKIGIPMGLNMYELYPFWYRLFTDLEFEVIKSDTSSRNTYLLGQTTIPSDTVCYPAKLMHGHVLSLIEQGIDTIFYPCMTYNVDEKKGDNHFNCPVVAYYPEVISANVPKLKEINFMYPYLGIHRKKDFTKKLYGMLKESFDDIQFSEVKKAVNAAYDEYENFMEKIRKEGREYIKKAKEEGMPVIVLSGRPYHIDNEISHGIDSLICELGAAVVSEDAVCGLVEKFKVNVLNQWTYHTRLYDAAKYVATCGDKNINFVQLVSFGCGVDAITTDEARSIIESKDKIYTQIKIDEITNLGAVKIRLRSLFEALNQ